MSMKLTPGSFVIVENEDQAKHVLRQNLRCRWRSGRRAFEYLPPNYPTAIHMMTGMLECITHFTTGRTVDVIRANLLLRYKYEVEIPYKKPRQ